jgi:hypothetical protein
MTLHFAGFSTSGTNDYLIQIGVTTPVTTGYLSTGSTIANAISPVVQSFTAGFGVISNSAANINHGGVEINHIGNNIYEAHGTLNTTNTASIKPVSGSITLAGRADILRLTTAGGTDTFDAGSVAVTFWG